MSTNTATTAPAAQLCKGQCRQIRPLFDFYTLGSNSTHHRLVCKDCWKSVNAKALTKRRDQRTRRKALLAMSKTAKRSI